VEFGGIWIMARCATINEFYSDLTQINEGDASRRLHLFGFLKRNISDCPYVYKK
jgi:hypothetical protein